MSHDKVLIYGARDRTFLSGTPFYFASALREYASTCERPFVVENYGLRRVREIPGAALRWALAHRSLRFPLFLLSPAFHERNMPDARAIDTDVTGCVSFCQILPHALMQVKKARPEFRLIQYIDTTLRDLMSEFDYAKNAPASVRRELIEHETRSFQASDQICVFHAQVQASLQRDYGIPTDKIRVLGRGANLDDLEASGDAVRQSRRDECLELAVVGKGPHRKGVFQLIEAIDRLDDALRSRVRLTLYGPRPGEVPQRDYLRVKGFVPASERGQLLREMKGFDLGVLLSEADSLPGSVWEFLTLGVPVWVTSLPNMEESLEGFPVLFEALPVDVSSVVSRLQELLSNPGTLEALRSGWHRDAASLRWRRQAAEVGRLLSSSNGIAVPA